MNPMTGPKGCLLDKETSVDAMTRSQQEAKCWERSENDAVKCHRKALDHVIQAAEEAVEHTKSNNLSRQEVIDAENELAKAVRLRTANTEFRKWA